MSTCSYSWFGKTELSDPRAASLLCMSSRANGEKGKIGNGPHGRLSYHTFDARWTWSSSVLVKSEGELKRQLLLPEHTQPNSTPDPNHGVPASFVCPVSICDQQESGEEEECWAFRRSRQRLLHSQTTFADCSKSNKCLAAPPSTLRNSFRGWHLAGAPSSNGTAHYSYINVRQSTNHVPVK
jgi:hypothetical protein